MDQREARKKVGDNYKALGVVRPGEKGDRLHHSGGDSGDGRSGQSKTYKGGGRDRS